MGLNNGYYVYKRNNMGMNATTFIIVGITSNQMKKVNKSWLDNEDFESYSDLTNIDEWEFDDVPDVPFGYCACEGSNHEFLGFVITRNGIGEYDILDDDMWYTINIAKKSSVWSEMGVVPRVFIHTGLT